MTGEEYSATADRLRRMAARPDALREVSSQLLEIARLHDTLAEADDKLGHNPLRPRVSCFCDGQDLRFLAKKKAPAIRRRVARSNRADAVEIARTVHDTPNCESSVFDYVEDQIPAEDAEPDSFAQLRSERRPFRENQQQAAMLAQLLDEGYRAHRVVARDEIADVFEVPLSTPAEAKVHYRLPRPTIASYLA